MGENSKIEWTDHTFNPWFGCTKISPACQHCYAESWAKRSGLVKWGDSAPRRKSSTTKWREPLKWNREAAVSGQRKKVFCASLADVFEDRPELVDWRKELFELIAKTPDLDWLLLTKRPENIERLCRPIAITKDWYFPSNVWLGTTVENDDYQRRVIDLFANRRRASVLFLSCEPLLGPVDLSSITCTCPTKCLNDGSTFSCTLQGTIDWVIAGGESGGGYRPLNVDYARQLRDQCLSAGVPFFFKQHGGAMSKSGGCLLDGVEYKQFPKAA